MQMACFGARNSKSFFSTCIVCLGKLEINLSRPTTSSCLHSDRVCAGKVQTWLRRRLRQRRRAASLQTQGQPPATTAKKKAHSTTSLISSTQDAINTRQRECLQSCMVALSHSPMESGCSVPPTADCRALGGPEALSPCFAQWGSPEAASKYWRFTSDLRCEQLRN